MSAGRFSQRRRRLVGALPLLAGNALLGLGRTSVSAQVEGATPPAACDLSPEEGCPLTLGVPFATFLAHGTDVHMFRITVPVDGEIGVVIAPLVPAPVKADLDLYLFNANDERIGAGLTVDTRAPGLRNGESVQARVPAGAYYAIVHVKASSDRSVRNLPYTIRLFASPEIWHATPETSDARIVAAHPNVLSRMALSRDGRMLATASDQTLRLWQAADGQPVGDLSFDAASVLDVAMFPDGRSLAAVSSDRVLTIWDLAGGRTQQTITDLPLDPTTVAIAPDGQTVVTVSNSPYGGNGLLTVHRATDGRSLWTRIVPQCGKRVLAFSPDGQLLAAESFKESYVLRAADGALVESLYPHFGGVTDVAFSPDGRLLASTATDRAARTWRLADRLPLHNFDGHQDSVEGVAFSPDGERLATASLDGTVRLWRVADGMQLQVVGRLLDGLHEIAYGPDGRFVVASGSDGTVRRWDIPP